jgi:NADH-quinone oxidoreductase subunit L
MEHAHESPWIMLGPLIPLAFGAIFAGWYAFDWFGGAGRETFWGHAIFVMPGHDSIEATHKIPEIEKWLPLGVALTGIMLAYVFYWWRPEWPGKVARTLGGLYRLVYHKYYFDELYDFLFVRSARCLGDLLWKVGDDMVIDGVGPDGVASLAVRLAKRASALETGYIYHYAFAMVIGVAAFVTWFTFTPQLWSTLVARF